MIDPRLFQFIRFITRTIETFSGCVAVFFIRISFMLDQPMPVLLHGCFFLAMAIALYAARQPARKRLR